MTMVKTERTEQLMHAILAVVLVLHGMAHLVGFVVPWRLATLSHSGFRNGAGLPADGPCGPLLRRGGPGDHDCEVVGTVCHGRPSHQKGGER